MKGLCLYGMYHAARHIYRYVHSPNDSRMEDFWQLLALEPRLAGMFPPVEALRKDFIGVFTWLASGYVSDYHHPGKIVFIWASEGHTSHSISSAWPEVIEDTEVEVYTTPGTHLTCITENVNVVAEHLRMCLSQAQVAVLSK